MPNFDLRIWGSIAGFVCAATYLFGFAVLAGTDYGSVIGETTNAMAFLAQNPVLMSVWYLTIYVVNGLFLALLVLALEDRIAPQASEFARVMRTLGLIWATLVIGAGMAANVGLSKALAAFEADPQAAADIWQIAELIENGIGGGNEILGGLLAVLVGIAGIKLSALPRSFGIFSLIIGVAGLMTVIAVLEPVAGPVFGLGYIVWFVWIAGILRKPLSQ